MLIAECLLFNYYLVSSSGENLDIKKKYIIFEDSHSQFFTCRKYKDLEVHLYRIHGASMAGFGKRESALKVVAQIRQKIYEHQDLEQLNTLNELKNFLKIRQRLPRKNVFFEFLIV